jgi:hypothetical protein
MATGPSTAIRADRLVTDRQGNGSAYLNIKELSHVLVVSEMKIILAQERFAALWKIHAYPK